MQNQCFKCPNEHLPMLEDHVERICHEEGVRNTHTPLKTPRNKQESTKQTSLYNSVIVYDTSIRIKSRTKQ